MSAFHGGNFNDLASIPTLIGTVVVFISVVGNSPCISPVPEETPSNTKKLTRINSSLQTY